MGDEAERQKKREMTCLEQINPPVKRRGATEKKAKNLTLREKMSGLKREGEKAESMLMQSQFSGIQI